MSRRFAFDLFRLNIEDQFDLFSHENTPRLRHDDELRKLFEIATDPEQDQIQTARSAVFKWSLRDFQEFTTLDPKRPLLHFVLARSILEREGKIVTDEGMSIGTSLPFPPLASTATCFVDLARHLVVVEHTGELAPTAWKDFLQKILSAASSKMQKHSTIELEPIPEKNDIVDLFLSFQRVTRMKVTLRIPNPELNRYTRALFDDLTLSEIREFTQDMKNPNGISRNENARPFASAVLAGQGYKKGEVQIEGFRNDSFEQVSSGSQAARGTVRGLRDFVRGLSANVKTKEATRLLSAITAEIDRIHTPPEQND